MRFIGSTDYIKTPALFTPFTVVHFYAGLVGYVAMKYLYPKMSLFNIFWILVFFHTLYEIKDLLCYNEWICVNIFNSCSDLDNSYINSIGDTIAAMLGIAIGPYCAGKVNNVLCCNALISLFVVWAIFSSYRAG